MLGIDWVEDIKLQVFQARTLGAWVGGGGGGGGFGGFGRIAHCVVEVHDGACVCMALGHLAVAVAMVGSGSVSSPDPLQPRPVGKLEREKRKVW